MSHLNCFSQWLRFRRLDVPRFIVRSVSNCPLVGAQWFGITISLRDPEHPTPSDSALARAFTDLGLQPVIHAMETLKQDEAYVTVGVRRNAP
jgi:hypothetical protein